MPKVKQESFNFGGERFIAVYHVDGSGTFSCRLPKQVTDALEQEAVTACTLELCQRSFRDALERYQESQTTKRRVILYQIQATSYIKNSHGNVVFNGKDVAFSHGAAVAIGAKVFDECEIKMPDGSTQWRYDEVDGPPLNDSSIAHCARFQKFPREREQHRMDYTPEREAFFLKIAAGLDALILQLDQLNDQEKALSFADSGVLALPERT